MNRVSLKLDLNETFFKLIILIEEMEEGRGGMRRVKVENREEKEEQRRQMEEQKRRGKQKISRGEVGEERRGMERKE